MVSQTIDNDAYVEDPKLQKAQTPVDGPLNRRYAVNWSDNCETDTQYAISEAKRYAKKTRARYCNACSVFCIIASNLLFVHVVGWSSVEEANL